METKNITGQENRRDRILRSAKSLFLDEGIEHTSINMIAKSAGIAKGLFYYYFETKDDLVQAIIEDIVIERVDHLVTRIKESSFDFLDSLLILVDSYFDVNPHAPEQGNTALWVEPEFILRFQEMFATKVSVIAENIVIRGQQKGYFDVTYPIEIIAIILEGLLRVDSYEEFTFTKQKVCTLLETTLHLPSGILYPKAKSLLHNFEEEVN